LLLANPSENQLKGINQVSKNLKHTINLGVSLGSKEEIELFGFSDASFVRDGDSNARFGYCFS
jgi:hypothetical protein